MSETAMITFTFENTQRVANAKQLRGEYEKMFKVVMDDGYENIFLITEEQPYNWYEKNLGYTELAEVVGRAIEKIFY